jgi:hypothetical protein
VGVDNVHSFIPGTYVRFSDHEMRIEYDTLTIVSNSLGSNNYEIIMTSSFQRKLDGRLFPVEHLKEKYSGVYDRNNQVINEISEGRIVKFDPKHRLLTFGETKYTKIN